MMFFRNIWTVAELELRQRVVSRSFYVILGVFALVLLVIVGLLLAVMGPIWGYSELDSGDGGVAYGVTVYLVLFLASIVTPILSGGAINADRQAGTLATVQITLVTTPQLLLGKFLAAWIASLSFAVVAIPFLVIGAVLGGPSELLGVVPTLALLVFELGFLSALGVGFSGITRLTAFSIVFAYLTVSVMTIGSLLAFAVGGPLLATTKATETISPDYSSTAQDACTTTVEDVTYPRYDLVYPLLALNPYVMIADVHPSSSDDDPWGSMLGSIKWGVRSAQIPPDMPDTVDYCSDGYGYPEFDDERLARTVPTWFVGGIVHTVIGGGLLLLAGLRLRTPAGKLPTGQRVA